MVAYDPVAVDNMREEYPDIEYAESAATTITDADGVLVVADWPEFAELDSAFDEMASPVVIDGRRIVDRRDGVVYEGLTW